MNRNIIKKIENDLLVAAKLQDNYDLSTINLIAPASPTPLKYFFNTKLRHNAITEGLLGHRPYAGVEGFNKIEEIACKLACSIFNAEHANVQPHSVSQANQAVYQALLENGDRVLAMNFCDGGHLTHGLKINFSGRFFNFKFYGVNKNGLIDYKSIKKQALGFKPKLIICGASSYPRSINFKKLSTISKKIGAYLMADLSHPAGFIATKNFPNPFPYCDVVTLTLDKTMLGPHGGIILCKNKFAEIIDKNVHPGVQSSVPLRRIYEMALCLLDTAKPWFKKFIKRLSVNMNTFEKEFSKYKGLMITEGTDTHLMVLNTYKVFGLTGKEAEILLESAGILTNRQVVPNEIFKPYTASGIRLGGTWVTARGFNKKEIKIIAENIINLLTNPKNPNVLKTVKNKINKLIFKKRKNDIWKNEVIY
jgi:glycine hydroxymethyltransferase